MVIAIEWKLGKQNRERKKKQEQRVSAHETYNSLRPLTGKALLDSQPVKDLLTYVNNWDPFIANKNPTVNPADTEALRIDKETGVIALPYPFVSPSSRETTSHPQWPEKQFYWDIYFINKGLLASEDPKQKEKNVALAKNHIENFQYLFDVLGFIPNASDISLSNRTQIPFLTGMIMDIYKVTGDKDWFAEKMEFAKREYQDVWMMSAKEKAEKGLTHPLHRVSDESLLARPLGRDIDKEHYVAAASTGEDDSAQWARRAYEYLPVGLNCALYKYENDFARAAEILGDRVEQAKWENRALQRKEEINQKFWNEKKGMYFDAFYDRKRKKWVQDKTYYALSSFMPLWAGLASSEQAKKMMKQLPKFETPYGLTIASEKSSPSENYLRRLTRRIAMVGEKYRRYRPAVEDIFARQQWDYPAIWAPMEYFAVDGMLRYWFREDAQRVMEKSLKGLAAFYSEKGTLPEKLNAKTGLNGENFLYPDQEGFGWTNAYAIIVHNRLSLIESQWDQFYATIAS